ncbi:MAG: hypothetical protein HWN67_15600 [Candidatus Helarchaeota archaeon]|nr:hypothetical protein [Candidatus Helarchaeota archaeon]
MLQIPIERIPPLLRESIFPIEGLFREPLLILEGIIFLLTLQYGILFFYRFIKEEREKNYMIRAWGIFFLTYTGNVIFFMISDFFSPLSYAPLSYVRQIYIDFGYVTLGLGALFFSYNAEREIQQKNHIFSIILTILLCLLIVDTFALIVSPETLAVLTNLPFVLLLIIYIIKFTSKIKEKWRLNIYGFLVGICIWISGYFLITDIVVESFGPFARFIGDFLIIIGISLISLLFVGLPSLTEFEWPKKMKKVFLMYKSGEYIADYNFQKDLTGIEEFKDLPKLIAGGLTGINQLIAEIVQSKQKLRIMDYKDVKIIFQYGNYLIAAIIVDEALDIYKTKLKKLIDYLETLYETYLPTWDGNLTQFQIVKPIIKRFFTL